jgi:hypothetical protein
MLEPTISHLISAVQPRAILRDIATYWGFRSTVPGPALSAASEFLARRHRENGMKVEVRPYKADDRTPYLDGHKLPLAWEPRSAVLEIIAPKDDAGLICSFAEEPLCLISNSTGTPPAEITAEVVLIPNAIDAAALEGADLEGKILFTDVWPLLADEQARKHGAVGLLTDSVTPPWLASHPPVRVAADVPDLTMWGVLNGHRCDQPLWGFSLTPRQGARLREIIRRSTVPVCLRAVIDARLDEGLSELNSACLYGTDLAHEEVWILSHSSEPGALDNASGCCASVEIARMLKTLIESGALPPLRRTIRFLSAVETEGYLPYLNERLADLPDIKAALAFDSIGADFRKTGSVFRLNRSPEYNPTFADDLLEAVFAAVAAQPNEKFSDDKYDLFPWQVDPCFPGNDNMIADGFFDIPTPMVDCWPDRFYHSNLDTPDKLSQGSLVRSTVIAAAYVYLLASAGLEESLWMARLTLNSWKHRILQGGNLVQGEDALRSMLRMEPGLSAEVEEMIQELRDFAGREWAAAVHWKEKPVTGGEENEGMVEIPTRLEGGVIKPLQWKPPTPEQLSPAGNTSLAALRQEHPGIENVWWLLNGRRTAHEVCARSSLPAETVAEYLDLLQSEARIRVSILGE